MERRVKLSFCLITLNEEANLPRCLRSCADLADEIVILDSGSTDATARIAKEFGARFEHQDWLGYVGQKNQVLSRATHEWVFSLDADEELSPELRADLRRLKQTEPPTELSGWSLPRCVLYEGRWIRHGDWYPDRGTRLWRRGLAEWGGVDPHDKLIVRGAVGWLRSDLLHYNAESIDRQLAKITAFSSDFVKHAQAGQRPATWSDLAFRPAWRFVRSYFFRRGFLDGWQGYYIAWMTAFYTVTRYAKVREAQSGLSEKEIRRGQ